MESPKHDSRSTRLAAATVRAARWVDWQHGGWALLLAALCTAVYLIGRSQGREPPVTLVSGTLGSALLSAGDLDTVPAQAFDRLQIRPDTTELQLSFRVAAPAPGEPFDAELQPVDHGVAVRLSVRVLESALGTMALVTMMAPPDGDYILRLRRHTAAGEEVVAVHPFRLVRVQP